MKNLSVLITGCSSGIGRALAATFADKGHTVFATARKMETLADLKGVTPLPLDVTSDESMDAAVAAVLDKAGRIDVLINNAGFGLMGPVAELSLNDFRRQLETNVTGPLALSQKVIPHMAKNGYGRIVNVGSVSGVLTSPFAGAYCASKAAFHSLSDAMRLELDPFGIRVITVQPGAILSEFGNTAEKNASMLKENSLYRPIEEFIKKRAQAGQMGGIPASQLAEKIVEATQSSDPPHLVRMGKQSFKLPALRWGLPTGLVDRILKKMFGLDHLAKSE